jgi:hypothetical protein
VCELLSSAITTVRTARWLAFGLVSALGVAQTNQNCMFGEIKSRLNSGNACCLSVQNLLSYSSLSDTMNIEINRTVISLFCMGVKLGVYVTGRT